MAQVRDGAAEPWLRRQSQMPDAGSVVVSNVPVILGTFVIRWDAVGRSAGLVGRRGTVAHSGVMPIDPVLPASQRMPALARSLPDLKV